MFSFITVSNSVVLADDFRTPIQGICTAVTTPTLPLSFIFYLPYFSFNLLLANKITNVLNCTVIFSTGAWDEEDYWHRT